MQIINNIFFQILHTYTSNFLLYYFTDVKFLSTMKHKYLILTYTETKQE